MKLKFAVAMIFTSLTSLSAMVAVADSGGDSMVEKPFVYIASPKDGATVKSPVTVKFGLENMTVMPAGHEHPNSGHHHLIIDAELPNLAMPIPMDNNHVHFGKGQTETSLELPPGKHTLQLLMGDHFHRPHAEPVYSRKITIIVE